MSQEDTQWRSGIETIANTRDEVIFAIHKDDKPSDVWGLKAIMQDIDLPVPIVSDMELTATTWKAKEEIGNYDEFIKYLQEHPAQ